MVDRPTVLLPIRVLERDSIPDGIPELLANAHIILLGYHVVPDQTPTGQAEMQFEERTATRLDNLEELLLKAGATVEVRMVFTHQAQQTIDRINQEHDCDAIIVPSATTEPERVLVPIAGQVGVDRVSRVVAGLFGDTDVHVTLFHVLEDVETKEDAETLLEGVIDHLTGLGFDPDSISIEIEEANSALDAIIDASGSYDAVVIGESDPTLITYIFGLPAEQVAEQFLGPVIVVQRPRPDPEGL